MERPSANMNENNERRGMKARTREVPKIVFNWPHAHHHNAGDAFTKRFTHQLAPINEGSHLKPSDPIEMMRDLVRRKLHVLKQKNSVSLHFIHPRIVQLDFYAGETWHHYGAKHLSLAYKAMMKLPVQSTTHFSDLLQDSDGVAARHVALIGHPGSGGTTVALKFVEDKVLDSEGELVLVYDFRELMYDDDDKLTLKDLLITRSYPDIKPEHADQVFSWIQTHQQQCVIVIDRLNTNLTGCNTSDVGYNEAASSKTLIANLIAGKVLKRVKILAASRPNEVIHSTGSCRADRTYLLYGFTPDAGNRLWNSLAGSNALQLWQEIRYKSPIVLTMLPGSPCIMQLAVAAIHGGCQTTTQMYHHMTTNYIASVHCDLKATAWEAMQRLAFNCERVELKDLTLSVDDVKDFMVALPRPGTKSKVLGGDDVTVCFIHLLVREYLAVQHLLAQVSCKEFEAYVGLDIIQRPTLELLLSGMLLDNQLARGFQTDEEKRIIFLQHILKVCKESTGPVYGRSPIPNKLSRSQRDRYLRMLEVVRESNRPELTAKVALIFPDHLNFSNRKFINSEINSLCRVIARCHKIVESINLRACILSSVTLESLAEAIAIMPGKIVHLDLSDNPMTTQDISNVCKCIAKVERTLVLSACLRDDCGKIRHFNDYEVQMIKTAVWDCQSEVNIIGNWPVEEEEEAECIDCKTET